MQERTSRRDGETEDRRRLVLSLIFGGQPPSEETAEPPFTSAPAAAGTSLASVGLVAEQVDQALRDPATVGISEGELELGSTDWVREADFDLGFHLRCGDLRGKYEWRNPERIGRMLRGQASLIAALEDAYRRVSHQFGPDPEVALEAVADPEVPDVDSLFAYVRTSLSADEALERLHAMDEDWDPDSIDTTPYEFCISAEFV